MVLSEERKALLQTQVELWNQTLSFMKSVALAVALDLRITDAIRHRGGGTATLPQILSGIGINPCKLASLRHLMRVLTIAGTFAIQPLETSSGRHDEPVYKLAPVSCLLTGGDVSENTTSSLSPMLSHVLYPFHDSVLSMGLAAWFRHDEEPGKCLYTLMDGVTLWEMVDVSGGVGGAAATIAAAFPSLKCTVLDLPHVVAKAPSVRNVQFVAGDMFESIPPANAIFLKYVPHDWGDDKCIKLLKNCKKAIPSRDAGGKVIIIDIVVGSSPSDIKLLETQVLCDLHFMEIGGVERDQQEWKKIFLAAGFKDYNIMLLGLRSIIELYP
ncbi:5-pentadecatrienyl resorcinol O-methyltransferase-like [Panicum virgatum]|uniref:O-methyltransferase ZRP4 n=1 Tax=Panicum virgatum TaxID=38727 RepID=A0A8T0MM44_PANVG|nr:5-pentadecatrienyl resorcinol O-methyltransferase-like [Panicum virgatum]KAG2538045.1 hypothetical protein PVAP13_9NG390100 [Panicum virgatum]